MASCLMPVFTPQPIAFERGEGVFLYGDDGRRYLDFMAGVAVMALGHCHPRMVDALVVQARKLWHCSNQYVIPLEELVARRFVENSFADSIFFCNSGAEAIECGIKLVRKYFSDAGAPDRHRIITMSNGFHGRTIAAIAASGQDRLLQGFAPTLAGFDRVAFGDLEAIRAAITPQTAAVLLEPVQGDGGIHPVPPGFLPQLRALTEEHGILLFLDEVQTGMGRTGKLFAYEWADITPDIVTLGKGIGAGFPIGACMVRERANVFRPGSHGTTLGGNPLAMAVANVILDEMLAPGFLDHVVEMGARLQKGLCDLVARYPEVVSAVRGQGLMLGLVCVVDNERLLDGAREKGLLVMRGGGNVIRLIPPLIVEPAHVDAALVILDDVCGGLSPHASAVTARVHGNAQ